MNKHKGLFEKTLVISIILLLIGVTIAPSINANIYNKTKIYTNIIKLKEEKLNISCKYFTLSGIKEVENKISVKDYERLSQLMDNSDIDTISYELNKLGLLPKEMNVEQATEILNGEYFINNYEKYFKRIENIFTEGTTDWKNNILCKVQGVAPDNYFIPFRLIIPGFGITIISIPLLILAIIFDVIFNSYPYPIFTLLTYNLIISLFASFDMFIRIFPWKIGGYVYAQLGDAFDIGHPYLNTSGLFGDWSLNNESIIMHLFGFIGLWVTIDDTLQTPGCEFIGNCLYIRAIGIDYN